MHSDSELNAGPAHDLSGGAGHITQDTALVTPVALRRRLRAARSAMTLLERQQASARINAQLARPGPHQWAGLAQRPSQPAGIIAAFWPLVEEPDLRPILLQWVEEGFEIALPEVVRKDAPLLFRRWMPAAPMQADHYGIPVPTGAPCVPDTVLVPTLGFTPAGARLGYGGGYYDRTLAALAESGHRYLAIGVAFACGAVPASEHQPAAHDMPLHAVITENGWMLPR